MEGPVWLAWEVWTGHDRILGSRAWYGGKAWSWNRPVSVGVGVCSRGLLEDLGHGVWELLGLEVVPGVGHGLW